jgi:hypothetical protein
MDRSELLIKCGFFKEEAKNKYWFNPDKNEYQPIEGQYDPNDADEEEREFTFHHSGGPNAGHEKTGYPTPVKTYRISLEVYDLSLEGPYFWMLEYLRQNFTKVDKVEDSFAAAENSAFFGITQQRLGGQQDKVSQFLATTGKMIKELFQMVRELRILDERLTYYNESEIEQNKPIEQRSKSAEITLKGIFIDLVQGGGKSAASVYGMARELEFITLPDLFFDAPPLKTIQELDSHIESMRVNFNENVLRVLARHLRQFIEWKKRTHIEHRSRKRFMLSYLKQHFEIINMYLTWVKPYLRNVEKLSMKEKSLDMPEIVSAFEGSLLDVELLAQYKRKIINGVEGVECILTTFNYRTRPEMKVVQEGYQRGPVHIGRFEMNMRAYHWLQTDIDNYKKFKEKEAMLLLGDVSSSVRKAMEDLGSELDKYLEEARQEIQKPGAKPPEPKKNFMENIFGMKARPKKKKKPNSGYTKEQKLAIQNFRKVKGGNHAIYHCWYAYHTFKKHHNLISW